MLPAGIVEPSAPTYGLAVFLTVLDCFVQTHIKLAGLGGTRTRTGVATHSINCEPYPFSVCCIGSVTRRSTRPEATYITERPIAQPTHSFKTKAW